MDGKNERAEEALLGEIVDGLCKRIRKRVEGKVWGNGLQGGEEVDDSVVKALRRFKRKSGDTDLEEYLERRYTWFCDSMMLQNVSKCYMEFNTEASELSVLEDLKPVETSYLDIRKSQRDEWRNMSVKLLTQGIAALKEGMYRKAASLFRDALKFDPESEVARNYYAKALKAERENRTTQTKFKQYRDEHRNGFSERVGQKRNRSEATDDTISSSIDEELRRRISNGDAALLRRMITEERDRKKRKKAKKKKKKKKKRRS